MLQNHFRIAALAFVLCSIFDPSLAHAEYRVFQLSIQDQKTGTERVVMSNLDNLQYPGYYYVKPTETVTIKDTWMCWRRSDRSQDPEQKYCTNPKSLAPLAPKVSTGPSANSAGRSPAGAPGTP
jgi:hypothetical protein